MLQTIRRNNLPDTDRLSVLAATILLVFALSRWVNLPTRDLSIQLPGFFLAFQINIRTWIVLITAGLTASGADWLLRDHPALGGKSTVEHWILPALTAWVIGIQLFQLKVGWLWWSVFGIGGLLLILILIAEYIVVDPEDIRHGPAAAGLTAVSFALYLILTIVMRSSGWRLFFVGPVLFFSAGLVSLRTFHLRLHNQWKLYEAGITGLLTAQIGAAFFYWPLSPVGFGLAVLAPAYALTSLLTGLSEGEPIRQAIIEPALVVLIVSLVALWTR